MTMFKVRLAHKLRSERVIAEYCKVDGGVLYFRNWPTNRCEYPVLVKCYAAGAWHSVEPAVPTSKGVVR